MTPAWPTGHGFTFTTGRGTQVVVAAAEALRPLVVGRSAPAVLAHIGDFYRDLIGDSQLRWIGPEKGRHASRHGRGRQCGLGPLGQA